MSHRLRTAVVTTVVALVATLVPASPATGLPDDEIQCQGRAADYLEVTTADGPDVVIQGTPGADDLVIDLRGTFESVRIETYAGADRVCITNGARNDLRVIAGAITVLLGGGNDHLVVATPGDFTLDIDSGAGNDTVIAPIPLFDEGAQNSNWNDTGGIGDRLWFLPMGSCGLHVRGNGQVEPTTGAGTCGSASAAVGVLQTTLPLVFSFLRAMALAGRLSGGQAWLVATGLQLMFEFILGGIITKREAGVDISGFEYLEGTSGDDIFAYDGTMRKVWGNDGDDVIYMNETTERVYGGYGDDVVHVADVNYVYAHAGPGSDTVRFDGAGVVDPSYGVTVDLDAQTFSGGFTSPGGVGSAGTLRSFENVVTTRFADTVTGSIGPNFIRTLQGRDTIIALAGDDVIEAGSAADTVDAGQGNDVVSAGAGRDVVWAGYGDDYVYGGTGNDTVHGEDGDDYVDGGTGNDTLYGEAGDDELRAVAIDEATLAWHITSQEGTDVLHGGDGSDICDQGGADTTSGCEIQHLRDFGPALYTREITEGGFPVLQIEVPLLSTTGQGTRSTCAVNGQVRARLPGYVADYSDLEPTAVQTTVTRSAPSSSSGLVTIVSPTTQTDTALSTASATRVAWIQVRTDRDATYSVDYVVSNNYHDFTQSRTFTGRLDCNTAAISASASNVADNGTVALNVNGKTAGLAYDWSVDRGSGWGFASGNAASKAPTLVFTEPGTYGITLTATTPLGRVLTDTHTVTVAANQPPTANAGSDRYLTSGTTVQLNGSGSDPDGDNLSFLWTKPAGVTWAAGGATSQRPTARFTTNGTYTFTLRVCDPSACDTDSMRVFVSSFGGPL